MPVFLFLAVFTYYAMGFNIKTSLYEWNGVSAYKLFVGLKNYVKLVKDPYFRLALKNTALYFIVTIPVQAVLGFILAYCFTYTKVFGKGLVRSVIFFPNVLALVVIGTAFNQMYNFQNGFLNETLRGMGLGSLAIDWTGNPKTALFAVILANIYTYVGFSMTLYITGLLSVPKEVMEAAKVDGASNLRMVRHITLPLLTSTHVTVIILGIVWLYPLCKIIQLSFKSGGWGNYHKVLFEADTFSVVNGYMSDIANFWVYLGNSLTVTFIDMVVVLSIASLAAFAFSKMDFKGKEFLYMLTLVGMMMPAAGFIVPYFITSKNMGLLNTKFCLIGPHVAAAIPMTMMLLRNSMDEISDEMIEASVIDGCSRRKVFTRMMLPLSKPAFATSLIFAFMGSWNDYLLPLVMINRAEEMTLTLLPQKYTAFAGVSNMGTIFASLVLISIPIFVMYLFAQKYMVAGMTAGTIK